MSESCGIMFRWIQNDSEKVSVGLRATHTTSLFIDQVFNNISGTAAIDSDALSNLQRSLLNVANAAASACQVQPDDFQEMKKLLLHVRALVGLGLESLSKGDVKLATDILFTEGAKEIFRYALSIVDVYRNEAIDSLKIHGGAGVEKLEVNFKMRKFGRVLWNIDHYLGEVIGFDNAEMLKGLFNRLPVIIDLESISANQEKSYFKPIGSLSDLEVLKTFIESLGYSGRQHLEPVTNSVEQ